MCARVLAASAADIPSYLNNLKSRTPLFQFTLDSASQVHVLTGKDALKLLLSPVPSNLELVGVSGDSIRADVMGRLFVALRDPATGCIYHVDFGVAHGLDGCPLNILSLPLLYQSGAIAHFEPGNCYFQLRADAPRLPFEYSRDGMFQIMASLPVVDPPSVQPAAASTSYAAEGISLATSASLKVWHRRLGHLSAKELARIHASGLVDGFKVSGPVTSSCRCDTCRQAKIRRVPTARSREHLSKATFVGHTVSADTKELPFISFRGHRYYIVFADHFSRYRFVYFMESKDQSVSVLRRFLADMDRLGFRVHCIQTDRGSEFFEQEGESKFNAGRRLHDFNLLCEQRNILHIVQPVEMKEKLAESCILDLSRDVSAMLWEPRLCPAFWADACAYACLIHNRVPNSFLGGDRTPEGVLTGHRVRWDKFRVFGCDVYEVIPNNKLAKVPGIPRGRKCIFVGFDVDRAGFKLFDPTARTYHSAGDVYFFEDFSERIDALRHHDQRRAIMRRGEEQPIVMNDFDDETADAVRSLYLDPDSAAPAVSADLPGEAAADLDASLGGALDS